MNATTTRVQLLRATCGHPLPPLPHTGASGYATTDSGEVLCYPCADTLEREAMATAERTFTAYVSTDGKAITTWSGGRLARVTSSRSWRTGANSARVYAITATAPDGSRWHGRNSGPSMAITLRRAAGGAR